MFIDSSDRAILRLSSADVIPAEGLEELSRKAGVQFAGILARHLRAGTTFSQASLFSRIGTADSARTLGTSVLIS